MDNQDKIFNRFKEAAENASTKDFPGMEKIWSRVEEKLDRKEDKNTISLWKKIAVAASLLLVISLGYQFLKEDKKAVIPDSIKTVTEKETIQNKQKDKTVISSDSQIVTKAEAVQILEKQIKEQNKVAINETRNTAYDSIKIRPAASPVFNEVVAPVQAESDYAEEKEIAVSRSKAKSEPSLGYEKRMANESFKASAEKAQSPRKSSPLVILNGNAISHSDESKRDKMMQNELPNLNPENIESLVVLEEPLYIIDGIYYSENDLFGKNPTSPYAPLNEQEIKTITILQDLEATAKYGEKGKKGVVIITTKTGKPAHKK